MIGAVVREAAASARSQPVASVVTMLMVAGMILAVMLTTGRTVGAEQQVLGSIDSKGTRSIVIRAEADAGITSDVLDRIDRIEGIEWAGAFSSATDATNAAVTEGVRVPVRFAFSKDLGVLRLPESSPAVGEVSYASPEALVQLGLADGVGAIALTDGQVFGVGGAIETPDFLRSFEPLVLVPSSQYSGSETVNIIVIVARQPELVAPVADAVNSVLAPSDPSKVTVQTSEALAQLRGLIQGQLGSFSRGLVVALLALTGALVTVLLFGLVMLRRKDFGRRRALGATRTLIVTLLLVQTAILACFGIVAGTVTAALILAIPGDPLPGAGFTVALAVLTLVTALLAALVPALVASRREPIRELRVP
ncbi:lipoprotein ABC transporter permease [Plantibacter flavus]|nr:lipoprotein ABC transporter permease [Plantibacter flavus]